MARWRRCISRIPCSQGFAHRFSEREGAAFPLHSRNSPAFFLRACATSPSPVSLSFKLSCSTAPSSKHYCLVMRTKSRPTEAHTWTKERRKIGLFKERHISDCMLYHYFTRERVQCGSRQQCVRRQVTLVLVAKLCAIAAAFPYLCHSCWPSGIGHEGARFVNHHFASFCC